MATILRTSPLQWTLLVETRGRSGADNMAIDESLLHEADRSGAAFLRLYTWDPPCLSLGRNEPALARYDRAKIERLKIDVVRRPTGGRAVWHEHEVTYAVAAPIAAFGSLRESYRMIHQRLAAALRRLGVPAELASDPQGLPDGRGRTVGRVNSPGACFAAAAGGEILIDGKKVVGSAQVRHGSAFLQHGSILLDGSQDVVSAVSAQASTVTSATTLAAALGRSVTFGEVANAIVDTWGPVTSTALYRPLPSSTPFDHPSWTWRR